MLALTLGTLLSTIQWGAIPPRGPGRPNAQASFARPSGADQKKASDLAELLAMIPPDATYGVTDQEMAHVSTRLSVRPLWAQPPPDYYLYAADSTGAETATRALSQGDYVQAAVRPGLFLVKRK